MQYLNEDRKSIGDIYAELYKPKTNSSVIKEASYEEDGEKVREFRTYRAWKSDVKKLDSSAEFTGDIDIDSYKGKKFHAEWDGEKGEIRTKIIKESEEFYDIEDRADQLDGDLDLPIGGSPDEDNDYLNDALEEKVYGQMNEQFGETFRRQCEEIKDKFNLSDDEFCMFFKGWFDEKHVRSHLEGEF